jgi:hypothetical protein
MTIWIAHVEVTLAPTGIARSIRFETFLLEITPGQIHVRNLKNHSAPVSRWTTFLEVEDGILHVRRAERGKYSVGTAIQEFHSEYIPIELHCSFHAGDLQSDGGNLFNPDPHSRESSATEAS